MEEGRRQELIDYCVSCQLPIIEDGAYLELCYAQEQPKTLKELDQSGMVIYLGTASKTLAPGLRIGWIVAPEPSCATAGGCENADWIMVQVQFHNGFLQNF